MSGSHFISDAFRLSQKRPQALSQLNAYGKFIIGLAKRPACTWMDSKDISRMLSLLSMLLPQRHFARISSALARETPSWNVSLHITTGAVPQLARHSTNSTE